MSIGSDSPQPSLPPVNLGPLRAPLLPAEADRYRWLGRQVAAIVTDVLLSLQPGISEREMNARVRLRALAPRHRAHGSPDGRRRTHSPLQARPRSRRKARSLRHAQSLRAQVGLAISITRFVHFGPLPTDLAGYFTVAAQVNAHLLHAHPCRRHRCCALPCRRRRPTPQPAFRRGSSPPPGRCYGYLEREWIATPNGVEKVTDPQAFAWNPSIRGGKVEDTVLLRNEEIEMLTATPELPTRHVEIEGIAYPCTMPLLRE